MPLKHPVLLDESKSELKTCLDLISMMISSDFIGISKLDENSETIIASQSKMPLDFLDPHLGESLVYPALTDNQPEAFFINSEETPFPEWMQSLGLNSYYALPISLDTWTPVACIFIAKCEPNSFSEKEASILQLLSKLVQAQLKELLLTKLDHPQINVVSSAIDQSLKRVLVSVNDLIHDLQNKNTVLMGWGHQVEKLALDQGEAAEPILVAARKILQTVKQVSDSALATKEEFLRVFKNS